MDWEQKSPWYIQSETGHKVSNCSAEAPLPFVAWAPNSKTETPALGYFATLKEATAKCEEHHQTTGAKQ